jgi:hypothetical protein
MPHANEPAAITVATELSEAAWIQSSLWPWPREGGLRIGSLVPPIYEKYVRVLNPASGPGGEGLPWRDFFERIGNVREAGVSEWYVPNEEGHIVGAPGSGYMDEALAPRLISGLFSRSDAPTWFALWDGYGGIRAPAGTATFSLPGREYWLCSGPLWAAGDFARLSGWSLSDSFWQPPNMWWPPDHGWFVHTEVDAISTFVGGSRAVIEEILGDDALETHEVEITSLFGG